MTDCSERPRFIVRRALLGFDLITLSGDICHHTTVQGCLDCLIVYNRITSFAIEVIA